MKKFVLILILAVVGGAAYSFDAKNPPLPIRRGNVLISPNFNLGGGFGYAVLGGTIGIDYALPYSLMVGGETGVAGAVFCQ